MFHRTLWTWRPFTGIVLILGGALFLGSAWIPLALGPPTPLTDSKGTFIFYTLLAYCALVAYGGAMLYALHRVHRQRRLRLRVLNRPCQTHRCLSHQVD